MFSTLTKWTSVAVLAGSLAAPAMADDKMKVVTTFTVIADIAQNVAGDAAEVVSVTKPGAEIHGYEPTPRDIVRASDADLILWNGMNLELWFEQFLTNLDGVPAVTVSDGIALTEFRANLNTSGGTSGQFAGRVNGGTTIEGTIVPERGRSAFRIISQDAGGVMRSANFLKQARGGNMELILRPGAAEGSYNGRLQASNVWLTDAPALAALLNAISVVGLLEQMSGNGIHFGDVDAQFSMSPDQITLFKSSAVGNSLGITMDGYYWPGNGVMDMQGVVSPIYLVNGIGGFLTRRGEGLVGFNYKLKGTAESPRVRILPLTIFTPGMFRDIFRRAPPGSNSAREEKAREAPGVAPSDTK